MIKNNYTVYKHISPSGKYYIGITMQKPQTRWRRDGSGYRHNPYFYNAIQKYGWDNFQHEILFENLTKSEAEQKEIELIACYKSNQRDYGYNISNGGNCVGTHSEESKKKIAYANQNRSQETREKLRKAVLGKKLSIETRKKMSESRIGRVFSEESKRKISESHKGIKQSEEHRKHNGEAHKKPVVQFSKNGDFIKRYDCAKNAGIELNIQNVSITACCRGKIKSAGGYVWKYESDYIKQKKHCNRKS